MLFVAILAGVGVILVGFAAYKLFPNDATEKRLRNLSAGQPEEVAPEPVKELDDEADPTGQRLLRFISALGGFGSQGQGQGQGDGSVYGTARRRLSEAGFRRRSAVTLTSAVLVTALSPLPWAELLPGSRSL